LAKQPPLTNIEAQHFGKQAFLNSRKWKEKKGLCPGPHLYQIFANVALVDAIGYINYLSIYTGAKFLFKIHLQFSSIPANNLRK